ncbi:MAG: hypothetical protein J6Y08_09495 [Clostridiales bacterium]|nr:hypothetical protein [Clostridiales bacterium]
MQYIQDQNLFQFTIIGPETDILDRLHYHALFAMLQEAACLDAEHHGFGSHDMDTFEACWLLLRMKVHMDKVPKWQDRIYIRTWSRGFQKVLFNRDFDIFDENMERIGWATSVWVIAHHGDHRPVRPQSIPGMEIYATVVESDRKVEKIAPLSKEEEDLAPALCKYADFSEIDRNMHVNNTRYIAWSEDGYYVDLSYETPIREVSINYSSEVKQGEEVRIFRKSFGDYVQIDGYEAESGRHVFSTILRS